MRRDIRILVLGDEQVGKTSLITSLITESFSPDVPHVLPEISIPPEITPDNVSTVLVDSSCHPEDRLALEHEIRRANVICLVYAIDEPRSFHRLSIYWLPYVRSLGANCPIVLVGNKIDLRGENISNAQLEEDVLPLMNEFKEVETCVECSAATLVNVAEVFYFSQKAVLYPTSPLYDSRERSLKGACKAAIRRIFRLCDADCDGVLDDEELHNFQMKCFKVPLQQLEIEGIKRVIQEGLPEGCGVIPQGSSTGITEEGFVYLHQMFIERGRLETTWTALRKFGYDDNLQLREDFIHPPLSIPSGDGIVELSPAGYQFLTDLFAKHDRDKDGALKWSEIETLFATTPGPGPWLSLGFPETTLTNEHGAVTLQGFLAQWSMTTLLSPLQVTLPYLAYLGWSPTEDPRDGLKVMTGGPVGGSAARAKRRGSGQQQRAQRSVFLCAVVGATGAGKTAILRSFINRSFTDAYIPTTHTYSVVNGVDSHGRERYLVLQEVGPNNALDQQILSDPASTVISKWDAICFVYDSSDPNSFAYICNIRAKYESVIQHIPALVVATKSDLDRVSQRSSLQPDVYCEEAGLASPLHISVKTGHEANLSQIILDYASGRILPTKGSTASDDQKIRQRRRLMIRAASITTGLTAALIIGGLIYMRWKRTFSKQ